MTRADLDKAPSDVAAMFDDVAERYDITNDVLALGQTRRWRSAVVAAVEVESQLDGLRVGEGAIEVGLARCSRARQPHPHPLDLLAAQPMAEQHAEIGHDPGDVGRAQDRAAGN